MPIDFHSTANRLTYTHHTAGPDWAQAVRTAVEPRGARVADIGCGGGVYSLGWLDLGALSVVGVDFSSVMVEAAREHCGSRPGLHFRQGDATATGLPAGSVDIVFERALIHHLDDLRACFEEAHRVLAPGGRLIVQDRTLADVSRPGTPTHLRGYFFERFPALLEVERARRPSSEQVTTAMRAAGFGAVDSWPLSEVRREYAGKDDVRRELLARTGRSILHELDDEQLTDLAHHIEARLPDGTRIREQDHWTLWAAAR